MDGVLLDTIGLDFVVCNELLHKHFGAEVYITRPFIRSIFAHHPPEFWRIILQFVESSFGISNSAQKFDEILHAYNMARISAIFEVCPGVREILDDGQRKGLLSIVVSNNPTEDIREILQRAGILEYFYDIVGNDIQELRKKPAPDTYLLAAKQNGLRPAECVVIEDSLLGAEAGSNAGCYIIGVATGGTDFSELESSGWTNIVYSRFDCARLDLQLGDVTKKRILSPNDFVSHMIEHIAWRTGSRIRLEWYNNDWLSLGSFLGEKLKLLPNTAGSGAALGMIDDGSAEVLIEAYHNGDIEIEATGVVDLPWFLNCRCEQLQTGEPLIQILQGVSRGYGARMLVRVCNFEDPHHTWEGIFRAVGIAISKMLDDDTRATQFPTMETEKGADDDGIVVLERSTYTARIRRKTAESEIELVVDFDSSPSSKYEIFVAPSISVAGLRIVLATLAREAGCSIHGCFKAKALSSSHVVVEDTALVLGRALKEILVMRMKQSGAECAGSSIDTPVAFGKQVIRVGLSVEGRKFWRFVPFDSSSIDLRRGLIIGHTVFGDLFSEDLDDFIDGLTSGLCCSVVVHVKELLAPEEAWNMIFSHLGKALSEAFRINPHRKGVSPGVKATLS
uniref:phosphoglycolate phosphatase n=1 Tax=Candidatus Kentrum eta TaxID=2126337 RepID=A0A450VEW2_9GAMM|nr:MAG: haloacid dehalogenase superfamily, subfamily IA, variant 3 with third motif having DD or ED [Candidatus Kentron sp. H]VFK03359.1 MAG: haloacid dehalogenase superfamily, subfamily IA, variant 3 with third motif having DD or ED [Candidatus Kentron sp. H]VFK06221.1 MAG: haloacid dehalogenase superfamily, subfamily IA, variant 3 with third motif having DD or ED [Candidatus Kentron sp. H]